jgi:hypothetical protein
MNRILRNFSVFPFLSMPAAIADLEESILRRTI